MKKSEIKVGLILTLMFLTTSCGEPKEDTPKPNAVSVEFVIKPLAAYPAKDLNQDNANSYYPVSYVGDTAHYSISVTCNNDLKEIKILKEKDGKYIEDVQLPPLKTFANTKKAVLDFKYVIADTLDHKFQILVTDVNDQIFTKSQNETGIISYFGFKPIGIQEWKNNKLYNRNAYPSAATYEEITKYFSVDNNSNNNFNLQNKGFKSSLFVAPTVSGTSDDFVYGWDGKGIWGKSFSIKNNLFDYINVTPKSIMAYYEENKGSAVSNPRNIQTGDVYVVFIDGDEYNDITGNSYAVVKIKDVVVNPITIQDYIEYSIKLVNLNRFK